MSAEHDVVIVGAGVAGALLAWSLAKRKRRVLVLEAGPEIEPIEDEHGWNVSKDPTVARTRLDLVRDFATARPADRHTHSPYRQLEPLGPRGGNNDPTRGGFHHEPGSQLFKSGYQHIVGGSTWHWLGSTPRLLPGDFEMRTRYGVGDDWPFGYEELEPWYCAAEEALGVSGDHQGLAGLHGAFRSRPFPMPEIWPTYSDLVVERALSGTTFDGASLVVHRTPQARNSRPYHGRPPCAGNSSCVPICPIGAKYDASIHAGLAKAAGAMFRPSRRASRVLRDELGRIVGVSHVDAKDLDDLKVEHARVVILAAHGIETPRLLLASGIGADLPVGRYLMDHPGRAAWIRASQPMYPFRGPPTTSGIEAFRDGEFRRDRAAYRISLGNDGAGRTESPEKALDELLAADVFGPTLRERVRARSVTLFRLSCLTDMLPDADNRVRLRSDASPDDPVPEIELRFRVDDYTRAGWRHAERAMAHIFERIGVVEGPIFQDDPEDYTGAGHISGTVRMGTDPARSVTDATGKVHGTDNLYAAGSGLFPTGGTANPTLTVAALALRQAMHVDLALGGAG